MSANKGRDYLPIPAGLAAAMRAAKPGEFFEYQGKLYSTPEPEPAYDKLQSSKPSEVRQAHKRRDCLKCAAPFWSEGPGNRLCQHCADANANSLDLEGVGLTGRRLR